MNKLFFIIFLSIFTQSAFAQTKKPRPSTPAPAPRETQTPVVSFGKSNTVYVNLDNPMTVNVEGVPNGEVQVTCDDTNISITNIEENKYIVRPFQAGSYTLTITSKIDWRTTTYVVSAKNVPDPVPMLMLNNNGLRKGGEIVANLFKGSTAMLAQIENFDFEAKCVVMGFSMTYIPKKGEPVVLENQGPMFSASIVATIKNCKPGDTFIFNNVKAKLSGDLDPKPLNNTIAYFVK
jgi:hypothetical protein